MRKLLIPVIALAVVAGIPTAVLAATGGGGGGHSTVNRQASRWTNAAVSTSSTSLRPLRALGLGFCARRQVTATLSVELSGAPAAFTIFFDGGPIMRPGPVRFIPAGGPDSFSFTFVENAAPFERDDSHNVEVDWRSPTGRATTLMRATLTVQYQQGTLSCP